MPEAVTPEPVGADQLAISIVGLGRVGAALGEALDSIGHTIAAISAPRSAQSAQHHQYVLPHVPRCSVAETVASAHVVLLCVPDDVLPQVCQDVAQQWRPGQIVMHTSGRHGLAVLAPAAQAGALTAAIHPAMTFTGMGLDVTRLAGCRFAVTAHQLLLPLIKALVQSLGGVPLVVADQLRPAYHAALCHSANYLVTLVAQAQELLGDCDIADSDDIRGLLEPLLTAALSESLGAGVSALTGPIARGDCGTVAEHLAALADSAPDISATYRALGRATAHRAAQAGRISNGTSRQLHQVLGEDHVPPLLS